MKIRRSEYNSELSFIGRVDSTLLRHKLAKCYSPRLARIEGDFVWVYVRRAVGVVIAVVVVYMSIRLTVHVGVCFRVSRSLLQLFL